MYSGGVVEGETDLRRSLEVSLGILGAALAG